MIIFKVEGRFYSRGVEAPSAFLLQNKASLIMITNIYSKSSSSRIFFDSLFGQIYAFYGLTYNGPVFKLDDLTNKFN